MKNLLCYFNLHTWKKLNPFAKICTNECCRELQEIHNDSPSTNTWNLSHEEGDYFVITRKSNIKSFKQVFDSNKF